MHTTSLLPALTALLALAPQFAAAHAGSQSHGHFDFLNGLLHLLSEPDHLALLAGAITIGVIVWRAKKRSGKQ
jgi:hydrogenase/urease accessory protein HupE